MWKKITSIAALFSSAAALSACTTSAGKPIECAFVPERCAKIPHKVKEATRAPLVAPRTAVPLMSVYGQPQ